MMAVQSHIEVEQWELESIRAIREEAIRARQDYAELLVEHKRLQAENERLRETLAVFADAKNWGRDLSDWFWVGVAPHYIDDPVEFAQQGLKGGA